MELMAILQAVTQQGVEPEVPDARDPVTAAAFTELLAGLVGPPPAPPTPADGGDGSTPGPTAVAPAVPAPTDLASRDLQIPIPSAPSAAGPASAPGIPPPSVPPVPAPTDLDRPVATLHDVVDGVPPAPAPAAPTPPSGPPTVEVRLDASQRTGPTPMPVTVTTAGQGTTADGIPTHPTPRGPDQALPASATADGPPDAGRAGTPGSAASAAPATPSEAPSRPRVATAPDPSPQAVAAAHRATTPAPAAAAAAAATPAVPAGTLERALAAQIVERVGALRHREDGDYELTLQLEPADLGRIELRVRLEGGVVHVQVGAHAPSTTDAVRRALPQLRDALVDAGLTAGSLDVGNHGGGLDRHPGREGTTEPTRLPPADAARPRAVGQPSSPIRTDAARGVDVLL